MLAAFLCPLREGVQRLCIFSPLASCYLACPVKIGSEHRGSCNVVQRRRTKGEHDGDEALTKDKLK